MPAKVCSLCGVEKPLSQFNTRPNGTRFSRCKPCRSVIACANRRLQRKYQREELAENAIQVLAAGPLSANQIAHRIGDVTVQAVAMALTSVPAHVTKHLQPHGAAIYTVTGAAPPKRTPRSHAPSLYDPWTGIGDEHRQWMEHYRALYRARQARIAARQEKPSC
jgi:hypothetical protein